MNETEWERQKALPRSESPFLPDPSGQAHFLSPPTNDRDGVFHIDRWRELVRSSARK